MEAPQLRSHHFHTCEPSPLVIISLFTQTLLTATISSSIQHLLVSRNADLLPESKLPSHGGEYRSVPMCQPCAVHL